MLPADSPFASLPAPGPHPATAELRAYAAGTLPPADEHRIEAHALDCERCAELLEGFSMSDAATTDQALAGLRARLQARVADDVAAPILLPASRPLWPRLAAAVALLGAVGAGIWGWEHQLPTAAVATTTPPPIAAPAIGPQLEGPAAIAKAKLPAVAAQPQSATTPPTAAAARPADYAAVRARRRVADPALFRRPAPPAAPVLAAQEAEVSEAADGLASQAAPAAAPETKRLAGRATSSAIEPAASVAADEAAAPKVAAAPSAAPAKALALADSVTVGQQEVIISRFSKAKAVESAALVRDKPMAATIAIAPAPVEGTPALRSYLYREAAKFEPEDGAKSIHGSVRLRFMVGTDGKLSNLQVVRGMRPDYDEESLRLICEGPAWRPGIAGGRRAALPVEITISY